MKAQIDVDERQAQAYVDFLVSRYEGYKKQLDEASEGMSSTSETIAALYDKFPHLTAKPLDIKKPTIDRHYFSNVEYSQKWTWEKKILYAFSQCHCGLTTRQVLANIKDAEPGMKPEEKLASVSANLGELVKSGNFRRWKSNDHTTWIYGPIEYFDHKGDLIAKHIP